MHRLEHIMGMPIVVETRDDVEPDVLEPVFDWFRWVDTTFSTYKDDSEVSRIARGELAVEDASPEVASILDRCEQLKTETNGYFDAYASGSLDPSGLVKGWSVDRAAVIADSLGLEAYAIYAGGDIRVRGGDWKIGIQHPTEPQAYVQILEVDDGAVATSGAYLRGGHIVDPHTGTAPDDGILSVTITGPDLATADAYATAAFAMGSRVAHHWVARLRGGYAGMVVLSDGRMLSTPSLRCAA
jgi:thiamine biosynthesis lipoprotein